MRALILAAVCAAFLVSSPSPALAGHSGPCAPRADFLAHLSDNYAEAPVAMGLAANGNLLEILVSPRGTWTIIITGPNGIACGVATGENWENVTAPRPKSLGA